MSSHISAKQAPPLHIPKGDQCCRVSIINTTTNITVPPSYLVEPAAKGFDWINLPTYSFHLKHDGSGKELLFDLGSRADWENSVPHIRDLITSVVTGLQVEKNVLDILPDGNVDINNVEALVLSHWHFDHSGNLSALPKQMKLVVGPGFKKAFLPGFPGKEDSPFHEADFDGRDVVEVPFSGLTIGGFEAYDYFGDGSFYIMNVPGHATGHISGLVRTTSDTFVLLGGDVCHFTGVIRPTEYIPLPDDVPPETALDRRIPMPCPCAGFLTSHRDPDNARTTPFFTVSAGTHTFYENPEIARVSIKSLLDFDADPNILVAIAHDPTSLDAFDFFPATMNDWKRKGWKQASHWGFLSELPYDGKIVRSQLADGLYRAGSKIRGLQLS